MHKVVYLPLAEADIMEAVDYIAFTLESPSAADALLAEIDKTAQLLSEFPYSCELYRTNRPMKDEIRKLFFPYPLEY